MCVCWKESAHRHTNRPLVRFDAMRVWNGDKSQGGTKRHDCHAHRGLSSTATIRAYLCCKADRMVMTRAGSATVPVSLRVLHAHALHGSPTL